MSKPATKTPGGSPPRAGKLASNTSSKKPAATSGSKPSRKKAPDEGTMVWVLSMLVQNEWVKTRRALRERQPAAGDEVSEATGEPGPGPDPA